MITSYQLRAARALLDWTMPDLAARSGVTPDTLRRFENLHTKNLHAETEAALRAALDPLIEFIGDRGVALRDDTLRIINTGDPYLQLLDDAFHTLKDGGEILFAFIRNQLSSPDVIASDLRLRAARIKFRTLIEEGDTYCLYPLREYRCVPSRFFQNNTQIIYGDKVGSMVGGNKTAIIIRNAEFAATQRGVFELIWGSHKMPATTTAGTTYV